MKLTKLQHNKIEEMIKEEMQNLKEGWKLSDKLHYKSKRNQKNLFEASELESDLSASSVTTALEQSTLDSGQACVVEFEQELLNHILSVLKSHGLVDSSATASTISNDLEDYDADELIMQQQEAATDISNALVKYATAVALIAIHKYSGSVE